MGDQRRRVLLIAVRDYPDADADFHDGIDEQVSVVRSWWTDPAFGSDTFEVVEASTLTCRRDVETFVHEASLRDATSDEVLVIYLTGHGHRAASGHHYLALPSGDPARVARDGYRTADLASAVLHSDAEHILVIANLCYAGTVEQEIIATLKDLPPTRRDLRTLAVVLTADFDQRPRVREFSTLLARVLDQLRSAPDVVGTHLTIEQFMEQLDRAARSDPANPLLDPIKVWPLKHSGVPTQCLPNPGHRPEVHLVGPAREQLATNPLEVTYWLDRASGRSDAEDPGWYFSGREVLTTTVANVLNGGSGMLVVTGTAGSGKSAVLARAVTLSDPDFVDDPRYASAVSAAPAATVPPPGSIDAAVLARNKTAAQVLEELATALAVEDSAPRPDDDVSERVPRLRHLLRAHGEAQLARHGRPLTVVLDGLDEATQPVRVITDVLGPLLRPDGAGRASVFRFVVGVRSSLPSESGAGSVPEPGDALLDLLLRTTQTSSAEVIRTDGPTCAQDIAAYIDAMLRGSPGAYGDDPDARAAFAGTVARQVAPSFLDARLEAERRRDATTVQQLDDATWLASLARGTVGQLIADLANPALPHPPAYVLAVLRATAFAFGEGIPWADIWPAVAAAVHGQPIDDVEKVIKFVVEGRLSGYLARATEAGRYVYRPAHDRLGQVLRDAGTELAPLT